MICQRRTKRALYWIWDDVEYRCKLKCTTMFKLKSELHNVFGLFLRTKLHKSSHSAIVVRGNNGVASATVLGAGHVTRLNSSANILPYPGSSPLSDSHNASKVCIPSAT